MITQPAKAQGQKRSISILYKPIYFLLIRIILILETLVSLTLVFMKKINYKQITMVNIILLNYNLIKQTNPSVVDTCVKYKNNNI
ncbi:hypothetical protein Eyrgjafa_gp_5 [Pelagibacter phage Eyrgjafa EXVC018P]|uniref:Transmembrane protein n=1 Tax=Pelagibacter phage Eyrgjafa EXVC018P TaxID=2736227 RepID=A0A7S5YAJ6_9CAUD|nr:hypothetical protein Eyrgjafa_gp_5 [Pelagibacter phage Eyrgjafa EXVC018P]QLF88210.1 hypothetical protein Gjalp_gp18 [Pelagibacter phage Gjalp EXVC020P]